MIKRNAVTVIDERLSTNGAAPGLRGDHVVTDLKSGSGDPTPDLLVSDAISNDRALSVLAPERFVTRDAEPLAPARVASVGIELRLGALDLATVAAPHHS